MHRLPGCGIYPTMPLPCYRTGGGMTSGVSTTPRRRNFPFVTTWNWTGFTTSPWTNLRIVPVRPS